MPQRNTNHIIAHIRPGGRSKAALDELTREVTAAWDEVVNPHARPSVATPTSRSESFDTELRTVFVLGTISAAREAGFVLPEVGLAILDFAFLVRYAVGLGGARYGVILGQVERGRRLFGLWGSSVVDTGLVGEIEGSTGADTYPRLVRTSSG